MVMMRESCNCIRLRHTELGLHDENVRTSDCKLRMRMSHIKRNIHAERCGSTIATSLLVQYVCCPYNETSDFDCRQSLITLRQDLRGNPSCSPTSQVTVTKYYNLEKTRPRPRHTSNNSGSRGAQPLFIIVCAGNDLYSIDMGLHETQRLHMLVRS